MLKRYSPCGYFDDGRFGVDLDARGFQSIFDVAANLLAHAGHQPVGHLDYKHPRFTVKRASFHRIAQKIGHFSRQLYAARASADYRESQFPPRVLRRGGRWHAVKRFRHPSPQTTRIVESTKRQSELLRAFNAGVVRHRAERNYQNLVRNRLGTVYQRNFARIEIYRGNFSANEVCAFIDQFSVIRCDVPSFYLATQILIEHRLEEEVIFLAHQRDVLFSAETEGGE